MTFRIALPFALFAGLSFAASAEAPASSSAAAPASLPVATEQAASGALDGRVFLSTMTVDAYDQPFDDRMIFADGRLLSEECQHACAFGAQPYFTRREGETIHFVADFHCPDAPQHVRFEGRVIGDRIEGDVVWTVERFYWTVQRTGIFEGALEPEGGEQAALTE